MLSPNAGFWWCRSCLHWELPGLSNESQVEIMIDKFWRTLSLQLKMARRQVMPSRGDSRPNWCSMTAFKKFDLSRTFDAYQWLMSVFTLLPKNNGILDLSHAFQFAAQLAVAKASFFVPWTGGNKHGNYKSYNLVTCYSQSQDGQVLKPTHMSSCSSQHHIQVNTTTLTCQFKRPALHGHRPFAEQGGNCCIIT